VSSFCGFQIQAGLLTGVFNRIVVAIGPFDPGSVIILCVVTQGQQNEGGIGGTDPRLAMGDDFQISGNAGLSEDQFDAERGLTGLGKRENQLTYHGGVCYILVKG